jgi:type II secretory pathway pseudopilin PulG
MKTFSAKAKISGLTLVELLVVICVIAILVAMLLPATTGPRKATMAVCLSHQKQIAIVLIMFNDDHGGKYPWQVSATNGGSMESVSNNQAFPHFRALSEYFGKQTTIFVCPTDDARHAATNYSQIFDENISYFLNLDATTNGSFIFSGDRHLEADGKPVNPGLFVYSTNAVLNWTRELHGKVQNGPIEDYLSLTAMFNSQELQI